MGERWNEMGVSKNKGTPKSSNFNRVFHYKPSILGYPSIWKHPNGISGTCPAKLSARWQKDKRAGSACNKLLLRHGEDTMEILSSRTTLCQTARTQKTTVFSVENG